MINPLFNVFSDVMFDESLHEMFSQFIFAVKNVSDEPESVCLPLPVFYVRNNYTGDVLFDFFCEINFF